MTANKDTAKAVNAATTLIKHCARYKNCSKCIFYTPYDFNGSIACAINRPYTYKEITEGNK